jgi:hypothetical protein
MLWRRFSVRSTKTKSKFVTEAASLQKRNPVRRARGRLIRLRSTRRWKPPPGARLAQPGSRGAEVGRARTDGSLHWQSGASHPPSGRLLRHGRGNLGPAQRGIRRISRGVGRGSGRSGRSWGGLPDPIPDPRAPPGVSTFLVLQELKIFAACDDFLWGRLSARLSACGPDVIRSTGRRPAGAFGCGYAALRGRRQNVRPGSCRPPSRRALARPRSPLPRCTIDRRRRYSSPSRESS